MANQSGGGSGGDPKKKGQFNEMILGNIKPRAGRETTKWLNDLTEDDGEDEPPMQEIKQGSGASPAPLPAQFAHPSISQTQVKWVDKLFDLFQQYEVEYNRAVGDAKLRVETERASITPESIGKMQGSDHYHYSGRLIMRKWTLVIRGNLSHIEGYIIPSDHFIGFENNINSYIKYFEFFPVWDGELKWSFPQAAFGIGQLPSVAKQIFGQLIKVSKGEAKENDVFGLGGTKQSLPPKPMGEDSFAKLKEGGASDFLIRHAGVFEDDKPTQAETPKDSSTKETQKLTRAQQSTTSKTKLSKTMANAAGLEIGLPAACEILGRAVDKELENLSKEGSKAFENHEFARVESLMKKTAKMKEMRDQILDAIKEWNRVMKEE